MVNFCIFDSCSIYWFLQDRVAFSCFSCVIACLVYSPFWQTGYHLLQLQPTKIICKKGTKFAFLSATTAPGYEPRLRDQSSLTWHQNTSVFLQQCLHFPTWVLDGVTPIARLLDRDLQLKGLQRIFLLLFLCKFLLCGRDIIPFSVESGKEWTYTTVC